MFPAVYPERSSGFSNACQPSEVPRWEMTYVAVMDLMVHHHEENVNFYRRNSVTTTTISTMTVTATIVSLPLHAESEPQ